MGLLTRLVEKSGPQVGPATLYPGDEPLEVVGESHYQDALWEIVGGRRRDSVHHQTEALLESEPENPYDSNAIRVIAAGRLVGYLSREDAATYQPGLLRLIEECPTGRIAVDAQIIGGGPRADGIGFLGIFLDHDPADFGVSSQSSPSSR
jgi:HIRAN domain